MARRTRKFIPSRSIGRSRLHGLSCTQERKETVKCKEAVDRKANSQHKEAMKRKEAANRKEFYKKLCGLGRSAVWRNNSFMILCGLCCLAFMLTSPLFAADITINDSRTGSVYGNSSDGGNTPNTSLNGNVLNIETNADIAVNAYGAYTSGNANVIGNTVNLRDGNVGRGTANYTGNLYW